MRHRYLVAYDIRNEKRLRRVYKLMLGFGQRIQYSVFFCDFSLKEKIVAIEKILAEINQKEDSVLLVDIGLLKDDGTHNDRFDFLGQPIQVRESEAIVI